MQYRSFPALPDLRVSTLGFGCMRLPTLGGDAARIDEEAATRLVRGAIDAGVNLVDTAYPYHAGQSERFLGRALGDGYRDRVQLVTKLPVWLVRAERDWERLLDEQLRRLDTARVDLYLLHSLGVEGWATVQEHHGLAALERARRDGRIGHLGFSFHGPPDVFTTIVDAYDWACCLIQLNFLDESYQAGVGGMRRAADRGVGVMVMEPLRGGALASAPDVVRRLWAASGRPWSPAEWALRWVWNHPEVTTVLSGMNAAAQLRENLAVADAARAGALTPDDLAVVARVRAWYQAKLRVPCTTCGYCQPCPSEVAIADVLTLYNAAAMFDSRESPAQVYDALFVRHGAGAGRCNACGECEPRCPQSIAIIERLRAAHAHLTGR